MERDEVPWTKLRFERKSQRNPLIDNWVTRLLDSTILEKINNVGIRKALTMAKTILIRRRHVDLEVLISCWSTESYTFIVACGRMWHDFRRVSALTCLPMLDDSHLIGITLDE